MRTTASRGVIEQVRTEIDRVRKLRLERHAARHRISVSALLARWLNPLIDNLPEVAADEE